MTQQTETKAKAGAIIIPVTLFEQNCTLIWCEATRKAVVIDPGGDVDKIQAAIKQSNVTVEKIWLTHGHIDHVGGAAELRDALGVPIEGPHIADKFLLDNVVMSGMRFGMIGMRDFAPDRWLEEGDQVRVGELTFDILHCPGHSPGSVAFFSKEMRFAHVGDVLFNGSVGRSDIPGGDHGTLIKSITDKLLPLGDDVGFICGHGPGSSIGQERMTNPFLTGEAYDSRRVQQFAAKVMVRLSRSNGLVIIAMPCCRKPSAIATPPPLFHQPGGRERAGDDGADIDAGTLRWRRRLGDGDRVSPTARAVLSNSGASRTPEQPPQLSSRLPWLGRSLGRFLGGFRGRLPGLMNPIGEAEEIRDVIGR